jgi:hypothetical protein
MTARSHFECGSRMAPRMMLCCALVSSLTLSCGTEPSKQLIQEYGQREYAQFDSPIHVDSVHSLPGLDLWRITPFKSVQHRNFVVGTTKNGDVVESPAIFLKLYKRSMTAGQAARLSIEILNDSGVKGVRHALEPKPHTMVGSSDSVRKWLEPPHFADGSVVYWTNAEYLCFEASTNLTTGVLSRKEYACEQVAAGDLDAGVGATTPP